MDSKLQWRSQFHVHFLFVFNFVFRNKISNLSCFSIVVYSTIIILQNESWNKKKAKFYLGHPHSPSWPRTETKGYHVDDCEVEGREDKEFKEPQVDPLKLWEIKGLMMHKQRPCCENWSVYVSCPVSYLMQCLEHQHTSCALGELVEITRNCFFNLIVLTWTSYLKDSRWNRSANKLQIL